MAGDAAPPPSPRDAAVRAMRTFILAAESFRVAVANYFGVGVRETEAVSHLRSRGDMTAAELGEALHLTTSTVSNLLDRLERSGLATREPHPTDRRIINVRLTDRAQQLAAETRAWLDQCLDAIPDKQLAAELLATLAGELEQRTAELSATTDVHRQRRTRPAGPPPD